MAHVMPTFPRIFFCYIEPALITFGVYTLLTGPSPTAARLLPASTPLENYEPGLIDTAASAELASMLFGLGMLGTGICWISKERAVVRWMVFTYAFMDIPHWGAYLWALGPDRFFDVSSWSHDLTMFMCFPMVTFCIKVAYLLGLFGPDRVTAQDMLAKKVS